MDQLNVGVYHNTVLDDLLVKSNDDGKLIHVDVSSNHHTLVISAGPVS